MVKLGVRTMSPHHTPLGHEAQRQRDKDVAWAAARLLVLSISALVAILIYVQCIAWVAERIVAEAPPADCITDSQCEGIE